MGWQDAPKIEGASSKWKDAPLAKEDKGTFQNSMLGALKGASDIGTTLLSPFDWAYDRLSGTSNQTLSGLVTGKKPQTTNEWRKQELAKFFADNANTDSTAFKVGEVTADVAGTAGAGGVLVKGLTKVAPAIAQSSPALMAAIESGGFSLGKTAPVATTAAQVGKNIATRSTGGAINGAVSAGLVNPNDASTGALIGAVMPGVVKGAGELGKATKATFIDPLVNQEQIIGKMLSRSIGANNLGSVVSTLGNDAVTPGVRFSAAQRTGNQALAGLEDTLSAINPGGVLNTQAQGNRNVLADSLRNLAQDDAAKLAAEQARRTTAESLYDIALNPANQQPLTPWIKGQITQLLKRPSINEASKKAQQWAIERGEKPSPNGSLAALHDVKTALDDMIAKATQENQGGQVKALKQTQSQLMDVLERLSPEYKNARTTYAQLSQPVNQMDIGTALANKLIPATAGQFPARLNASSLATALRNPDQLAQLATGFKGAKLATSLTPQQLAMVNGVSSDASRIAEITSLGMGAGSPTARRQAVQNFVGDHITEASPSISAIIASLGNVPGINVASKGIGTVGGMIGGKINQNMAAKLEGLLASDPSGVQRVLQKAMQGNASRTLTKQEQMILDALKQGAPAGLLSLTSP